MEFVRSCTPSWFRFGQQQDSSEFYVYFLDNLNEQLKSTTMTTTTNSTTRSLIEENFGIRLNTRIQCSKCGTTTSRTDTSFSLPLSFVTTTSSSSSPSSLNKPLSLQALVNNYFHTEQLSTENDNSYSCSACESLQNATKRIRMEREAPHYLVLTLNRFVYQTTSSSNVKIMDRLEYPEIIEIEVNDKEETSVEKYRCIAIIVHSGSSLHYGHYYSYIHNQLDDSPSGVSATAEWLLANDSQISTTTFDGLINNLDLFKNDTPYVLFYARLNIEPNSSPLVDINVARKKLVDLVDADNRAFNIERNRSLNKRHFSNQSFSNNNNNNHSASD